MMKHYNYHGGGDDDDGSEWVEAVVAAWEAHLGRDLTREDEQRVYVVIDAYNDGRGDCWPPSPEARA